MYLIVDGKEHLILTFVGDLRSEESVENLFEQIQKKYQKAASVLINCAGVLMNPLASILETSVEEFNRVMDNNFKVLVTS